MSNPTTRAHAPDCGIMFAPGVCDCAVGALDAAEAEVERLRIEVRRQTGYAEKASDLAVSAGWRLDEAIAESWRPAARRGRATRTPRTAADGPGLHWIRCA